MDKFLIVSLSGRKGSGKTELAKICVEKGFTLLSFADALKDMVCECLNINREELRNIKENSAPFVGNEHMVSIVSGRTTISPDCLCPLLLGKQFSGPREMLQFLGTDIIRRFVPNWHIEQLKKRLRSNEKYCIDDCRFPNEKKFLEGFSSYCFFIIKPNNFAISNHESEVSLKPKDFDEIIINNCKLSAFRKKWSQFIDVLLEPDFGRSNLRYLFKNKLHFRNWLKKELATETTIDIAQKLKCSRDKIVWWADRLMLNISREKYKYDLEAFSEADDLHSYSCGLLTSDGCIKFSQNKNNITISFTSCDKELADAVRLSFGTDRPFSERINPISGKKIYDIDCQNYYIIENLKHWNLLPKKSTNEQVPDIIKNDLTAIKHWIVGMIDGDGSIYRSKSNIHISMLGSERTMQFISDVCPCPKAVRVHKKNLFEIRWCGKEAIKMAEWLGQAKRFGLPRKWNHIKNYLSEKSLKNYSEMTSEERRMNRKLP